MRIPLGAKLMVWTQAWVMSISLWKWLPHRFLKLQSSTTLLFRTTITRKIIMEPLKRGSTCLVLISCYIFALWSGANASAKCKWLATKREGPREGERRAAIKSQFPPSRLPLCANLHREKEVWERCRGSTVFKMQCFAFCDWLWTDYLLWLARG